MRQGVGATSLVLLVIGPAGAGELMLANGSRLDGVLTNEMLVVSTGADLIELAPEQVSVITPGELRLRDGRIVRGTLVGGRLTVRTSLGEIAVQPDELRAYRAHGETPATDSASPPASTTAVAKLGEGVSGEAEASQSRSVAAPPPLASTSSQGLPSARRADAATPQTVSSQASAVPTSAVDRPALGWGFQLEVIADDAPLRRHAIAAADPVGRVSRGQRVTYVDTIDRRLRVFNVLLFDGGHWVRVRAADGSEGWLPAGTVREAR